MKPLKFRSTKFDIFIILGAIKVLTWETIASTIYKLTKTKFVPTLIWI